MMSYTLLVILFMMIINAFVMPSVERASIQEVDYGTFMTMTENKQIEKVEFRSSDILFTDKDGKAYCTGHMEDDGLVQRLYEAGAKFGSDIIPETSPMAAFLLNWVLPIAIFGGLGYYRNKKMMDRDSLFRLIDDSVFATQPYDYWFPSDSSRDLYRNAVKTMMELRKQQAMDSLEIK